MRLPEKKHCKTCKYSSRKVSIVPKEIEYSGSLTETPFDEVISLICEFNPKHIEVSINHKCGQWKSNII